MKISDKIQLPSSFIFSQGSGRLLTGFSFLSSFVALKSAEYFCKAIICLFLWIAPHLYELLGKAPSFPQEPKVALIKSRELEV